MEAKIAAMARDICEIKTQLTRAPAQAPAYAPHTGPRRTLSPQQIQAVIDYFTEYQIEDIKCPNDHCVCGRILGSKRQFCITRKTIKITEFKTEIRVSDTPASLRATLWN
jgi:hypothetical protein